ncbi:MAG: NAD(P)-dependent oxidoreductase [Prevotella sp.]|uniref:NAD-dependent epimerase/dehydratase family protein n=1 Tax=Prevotella sp. TaxID=59823 RepID=UPI002A2DB20B|nr:NAD(P)-dependent oxidoreductase [Prevotella sp.]MDD7318473.1 NAD(P)-dependent oxidoreductase [Prevotellaceae bacterium]MDY4020176.1 NAD(P)-dependent oxidoreductase [Prevotella sp.]
MKILITGATGFIGSFIAEEALRRGMETWAAIRGSSSTKYLTDERINFIKLNLDSEKQMREALAPHRFDYVVHAAGVTKCIDRNDFFRVNTEGTKNLVMALLSLEMPIRKFIYLSSLSVFGPAREDMPYREITDNDTPVPNTAYGQSKLAAENFLREQSSLPYVVLRPTGVYGPRERDYFMMAKSIKNHVDFAVGFRRQVITFVYVDDVVQAVFLAIERGRTGASYFLTDGRSYSSQMFSDLLRKHLGVGMLLRIKAPLAVLRAVTFVGERYSRITRKITALNDDKYNIMRQRNWLCDIKPAREELGYSPTVELEEGVRRSVEWYRANKWI